MSNNIRPALGLDYREIYEINRQVFGGENEARLVENLRYTENFIPQLSLVAEKEGQVVGYIVFSRVLLETQDGELPILALAPMAVRPEFQNQGIGTALVKQGLEACRQYGEKVVVVLGHTNFYPRFGFIQARVKGIRAPYPVPDEVYMLIELAPDVLDEVSGTVKYPSIFDGV
jgi:putative acetyltransferase